MGVIRPASGARSVPADTLARYSLPEKLPGTFTLKTTSVDGESVMRTANQGIRDFLGQLEAYGRQEMEADLRANVFTGTGGQSTTFEILIGSDRPEGNLHVYPWDVSLYSGSDLVGKYQAKQSYRLVQRMSNMLEGIKIDGTNAALLALEDIKRQIAADRANVVAKMAGAGSGKGVLSRKSDTGKLNVAVSDLSAESVSQGDASIVADWLRGALVSAGTYTVVERSAMQKILSEQAFQQTGCTSQDCAVRLGKLLNVRVVDIETGQVVYSDSANGATTKEVEANIKALAQRLSR